MLSYKEYTHGAKPGSGCKRLHWRQKKIAKACKGSNQEVFMSFVKEWQEYSNKHPFRLPKKSPTKWKMKNDITNKLMIPCSNNTYENGLTQHSATKNCHLEQTVSGKHLVGKEKTVRERINTFLLTVEKGLFCRNIMHMLTATFCGANGQRSCSDKRNKDINTDQRISARASC